MLHDYLVIYEIKDEELGVVHANATVHDFPLTYKAIEAFSDKVISAFNKAGGHAVQVLILNIIQLEKEPEGIVTEYNVEVMSCENVLS